ncbi:MAG: hypothetical protein WC441_05310 [Patescibacteria group bacterium]
MSVMNKDPEELALEQGIYRAAFPAYRVFIFGYEVTEDVTEVRVNCSGGSAERSAGSCSFTLLNPYDKYILNHEDMRAIGKGRNAVKNEYDAKIKQAIGDSAYAFSSNEELESMLMDDTAAQVQALMDQGYSEDASVLAVSKAIEIKDSTKGDLSVAWNDAYVPGWYKREILEKKMTFTQETLAVENTNMVRYDAKTIFDYPMQEGDCIFHANDPVRIAFRDPYDPRIWYWMFSGFMDTFTENVGTNNESLVSITCTDVSKMARYALVNVSSGTLDLRITDLIREIANVATTNVSLYQEFFGNLTLFEILETVFFGSGSLSGLLKESTAAFVANMTQEDLWNYVSSEMSNGVGESTFAAVNSGNMWDSASGSYYESAESYRPKVLEHMISRKLDQQHGMLQGRDLPPVTGPREVCFQRASDRIGLSAFFLGTMDEEDKRIGQEIKDLGVWTDILNHRVQEKDLLRMSKDGSSYFDGETYTVANIISAIGTDIEHYPVGSGKVYYFAPAKLGSDLGRNVMDKSLTQSISMHSVFRDRLSLIYDLAERIDFRFYATPRGDLVFEMPLYDFGPEYFATGGSNAADIDTSTEFQKYKDVFGEEYAGKYGSSAYELTSMQIFAETLGSNFEIVDYSKPPKFDYMKDFTIEKYDQIGYSNTSTDEGVFTVFVSTQMTISSLNTAKNANIHSSQPAFSLGLIPTLGARVGSGDVWGYLDTAEAAEAFSALQLNKINAEARNLAINTVPKFGLMVNRPVFWRQRNYYANIVSLQHSIMWMGDCATTINLNQVRGWTGDIDAQGYPLHSHFGGDRPFNLAEFLQQYLTKGKPTQSK